MKGLKYYINYIKNVIKTKINPTLLLSDKSEDYTELIQNEKIQKIIKNMPKNIDDYEKAYYIYLELGKIITKKTGLFLSTDFEKIATSEEIMQNDFQGVCKTAAELYCSILAMPEINIKADVVRFKPNDAISHVETVLHINNNIYFADLIADLENIKVGKKTKCFCYNMVDRIKRTKRIDLMQPKKEIEERYNKKLSNISEEKLKEMDKKFNYSYVSKSDNKQVIYTDDVYEMVYDELKDPKTYKESIYKGQDVKEKDKLKYKMDFVFENINTYSKNNGEQGLLEVLYIHRRMMSKLLKKEEIKTITDNMHICTINGDRDNLTAILKVNDAYYLYSPEKRTFVEKEKEEVKEYIEKNKLTRLSQYLTHNKANKEQLEDELEI